MKLTKAYRYLLGFIGLSVMFSTCYYMSYRHALNQFNKRAVERKEELLQVEEIRPTNTPDRSEAVTADTRSSDIILPSTRYILETYNLKTDTIEKEDLNPPGHLVGLSRDGVMEYINNYVEDMPLSEFNKGLVSYELLSFSDQQVVLRKSYDEGIVPYRFYIVVKKGEVVVYHSDLKTVHTYTAIEAKNLPEQERIKLSQGFGVDSEDELYSILESYTS